jgi:hypothetical protein
MPLPSRIFRSATMAMAIAMALAGCGGGASDGIPREPISGKVTLDGKALDTGLITFSPTEEGKPTAGTAVQDGSYRVSRSEGPSPGLHRVNIWSQKPTGKKKPNADEPGTFIEETRETIPARYNHNSELKAEVKPGAANQFNFDLTSEAAGTKAKAR